LPLLIERWIVGRDTPAAFAAVASEYIDTPSCLHVVPGRAARG
jgi:hypothetical protein